VFLGGLGVGSVLLGRRAERSTRPLLFYGNLEVGVSLAAALSPLLMGVLSKPYLALGGADAMGHLIATVARLVITALSIGPAVILMGGTLPAAARAVEGDDDRARSSLAFLYGANTLGAVAGALLGTFVLFEAFGVRLSLWMAALLNLLVAVVARSIGRFADEVPPSPKTDELRASERPAVLAYAVAAGVGFAFLVLELVWYRLLAPLLGGSTYTFGLVLAVALAGIGLGGFAYSLRPRDQPATRSLLAAVTLLEGVLVALPLALGDHIAIYAALTRPLSSVGFPALVGGWTSVTVLVVFPAALASGYQFPLLVALLGEGRKDVARHVGTLYAFNTAGSIAGSLLGGFVLIPRLGAVGSWRLVALVLVGLGLTTIAADLRRRTGARAIAHGAGSLALALLGIWLAVQVGPTAVWRHQPIGAGRVNLSGETRNSLRAWSELENERVIWQADGIETAVCMRRADQIIFAVDGKNDGSVFSDRGMQAGSGLIAALGHPAPRRAFVIGLGTGMTAGWLAAIPGMDRVDVAELEPSILEVARRTETANLHVLSRPNVTLHIGDGREIMLSGHGRYDLIVSEPSNPYRAGISSFYTREFYESVKSRLEDGGIFVQWLQGYEIDADTVRIVGRTLRSVLPHVEIWQPEYGDILLLASRKPRVLDAEQIRLRLEEEPFRSGLPRTLLIGDLEGLLARFVAGDEIVATIAAAPGISVNSDDQNALDYAFARSVGSGASQAPDELLAMAIRMGHDRPAVRGRVDWDRVAELRPRAWLITEERSPKLPMTDAAAERARAVVLGCTGRTMEAARAWESRGEEEPRDDVEKVALAVGFAELGDGRALRLADALGARGFTVEAELVRAHRALYGGDPGGALDATQKAIAGLREQPLTLCRTAREVLALARQVAQANSSLLRPTVLALLERPFAADAVDEEREQTALDLAASSGDAALCVRALGRHAERPLWREPFLRTRLGCLEAAGSPLAERAAADLVEFLSATSGSLESGTPQAAQSGVQLGGPPTRRPSTNPIR
jgi:spermidine synthase/MFS family permease